MDHSVDSIGYGVSQIKKKLTGKEIAQLSKSGVSVNIEHLVNHFIFMGDTYITPFINQEQEICAYKSIIIECSFMLDDDYDHAIQKKHIHWSDLHPFVVRHPECDFILTHFSPRYKQVEIQAFFSIVNLPNIVLWTQSN